MYKFYYEYVQRKYRDKMKLLCTYMDTDSFILEVETNDFFEDAKKDLKEWFDTSNYHKDMVLPQEYKKNASVNKKVIGKMKNVLNK